MTSPSRIRRSRWVLTSRPQGPPSRVPAGAHLVGEQGDACRPSLVRLLLVAGPLLRRRLPVGNLPQ